MFLIKKLIPIILPILFFIGFELIFQAPERFWNIIIPLYVILLISIFLIFYKKYSIKSGLNFLVTPVLLFTGTILFLAFLENLLLKHLILLILSFILGSLLHNIFVFINQTQKYQAYSLENLIDYTTLIIAFLFFSSFYVLLTFLNIPVWKLCLLVFALSILMYHQLLWVNKISMRRGWIYIFISTLIISEMFWTLSFLPTSYFINALVLTLIYYVIVGIGKLHLLDHLEFKTARKYIVIAIIGLVLTLSTAKWL